MSVLVHLCWLFVVAEMIHELSSSIDALRHHQKSRTGSSAGQALPIVPVTESSPPPLVPSTSASALEMTALPLPEGPPMERPESPNDPAEVLKMVSRRRRFQ